MFELARMNAKYGKVKGAEKDKRKGLGKRFSNLAPTVAHVTSSFITDKGN